MSHSLRPLVRSRSLHGRSRRNRRRRGVRARGRGVGAPGCGDLRLHLGCGRRVGVRRRRIGRRCGGRRRRVGKRRRSSKPEEGRTDPARDEHLRQAGEVATAEARARELARAAPRSSESSVQPRPQRLATHVCAPWSVRGDSPSPRARSGSPQQRSCSPRSHTAPPPHSRSLLGWKVLHRRMNFNAFSQGAASRF